MRKKAILFMIIVALMTASCAIPKKGGEKKGPQKADLMSISSDSLFLSEFEILLTKDKRDSFTPEAVYRYFDLLLFAPEADFQNAFELVKELNQGTETALLLNNIAWYFRNEEAWFERLFHLAQYAVSLTDTSDFIQLDKSKIYYSVDASPQLKLWANIHDTFAWFLIKNGEKDQALAIYEKILRHYEQKEIYANYAELLYSLNRREAALRAAIRAMELNPGDIDTELLLSFYAKEMAYSENAVDALIKNARDTGYEILSRELADNETERPLPFFQLSALDGSQVTSELYTGSAKIIIIWNLKCESCIQALPNVEATYQMLLMRSDAEMLTISAEPERERTHYLMRQNDYAFPVYFGSKYLKELGVDAVPEIIIADASDVIRYHLEGIRYMQELSAVVHLALQNIISLP
jgi:tetratricopeptide (TPR) repeat protein